MLVQVREGRTLRFRCHTGHAYSAGTLLASVTEAVDRELTHTIRAMEEAILIYRQLERHSGEFGDAQAATKAHIRAQPHKPV